MRRESLGRVMLGLGTGTAFGFLLHKGRAAEYESFTAQLLMKSSSLVKVMATASALGSVGTHTLGSLGLTEMKIKPLSISGVLLGGTLFGAGMALLGYCPGTDMAALGKGRKDAAAGLAGMFAGALAFVKYYPPMKPAIEQGLFGKKTLPEITGTSPWLWVAGLSTAVGAATILLED